MSDAMIRKENVADIYPLSPLQKGLLFHSLLAPEAAQYFEQLTCRLHGPLDLEPFESAWQEMIERHSILRSAFLFQGAREPVQAVMKKVPFAVQALDWRDLPAGEQARRFEALLAADQAQGFALNRPPLMRVTLVRLDDEAYRLVWSHHHLLLDGWSLPRLLEELLEVYHARRQGRIPGLARVRPYGDYIDWLRRQDHAAAERFWRATLGDFTEPTPLAVDHGRGTADRVITRVLALAPAETAALRRLAGRAEVTLNTVIQAAWATVLGRHGRSEDVVFGVTVSGRPADLPGAEDMVGLFINTLPLRVAIDPDRPIEDWLPAIQARQSEIQRFAHASLTDIQGWSGVPRGEPLFHTLYAFENFPLGQALDTLTGDIEVREPLLVEKTSYPLTLVVVPGAGLDFKLSYDSERIPGWVAAGMLEQVRHVLACMAARPGATVREIGLVPAPAARPLPRFEGQGPLAHAPSLPAAFAAAVQRSGDRVAVTDGDRAWTYRELDARARVIAARLRGMGVGPDVRVGLLLDRSAALIAAMLGVVQAGGAYVPLDPRYPAERLRMMAADSGCVAVLADEALAPDALPCPVVDVEALLRQTPDPAAPVEPGRDHAAYVIYTSGSTGAPKGVLVTQGNVLRLFSATHHWFGFDDRDVWTFFHSFAFDFSVWEIWGALLHGGRLVVVPYALSRDPDAFLALLAGERVTVLSQTPSAFAQLMAAEERRLEAGEAGEAGAARPLDLSCLRTVVFGGEALDIGALGPWLSRHGDQAPLLVNMYGITETTVHVTYRPITAADAAAPRGSLIGQPIPDLDIRLLDAYGHPVPDGVPGEICVAGAGLARGYLHQPALTAQRFVPDPACSDPAARMYRSGDLARRLPDGDLQYGGRMDAQVKVRGYRIELGEIEAALAAHPAVARASVLVHDDGGGKRVAACFERRPGQPVPTAAGLRAHLSGTLPDHMLPELYVATEAFPLTANGKLDRRALRALVSGQPADRVAAGSEHAAPETPAEIALARIWQQVLDVPRVGLDDGYFALGGDSIRAIRVVALARKAGLACTLRDLFAHPTVRELAAALARPASDDASDDAGDGAGADAEPALPDAPFALISAEDRARLPAGVTDAYPLAHLQAGMLFHGEDHTAGLLYHDVFRFGLRAPFAEEAWTRSLQAVLERHPVLRTSVHFAGYSRPLQLVHDHVPLPLRVHDLRSLPAAEHEARVDALFEDERRAPYDWQQPGLWRVHLVRREEEACELILSCHHAILDGWSLASLVTELAGRYLADLGLSPLPGPDAAAPAGHVFRDFVALEQHGMRDPASLAFWDEILADAPLTRVLRWHGHAPHAGPITVTRALSPAVLERLRSHAALARLPLRTLLLAAHVSSLSWLTGERDVVTGLVSNGRPETDDGARALGLFLNTLPLRVRPGSAGSWLDLARMIQDAEHALLPHRRVPLAVLKRRQGGRELIATSFNYVHFHVYEGILRSQDLRLESTHAVESIDIPFSVTFSVDVTSGQLHLSISADGRALAPAQVEAAADLYARSVELLAANPEAAYAEVLALPPAILRGAARPHPFAPVHEVVARRAAQTPRRVAVELGDQAWTFAALDRASARLAAWLRDRGLRPGQPVILCCERSFALIAAMLGTLRAGGAYVPVDPDGPPARLAELAAALDPEPPRAGVLALAGAAQASRLPAGARVLIVEDLLGDAAADTAADAAADAAADNVADAAAWPSPDPAQPAYVLFTSGSTGTPRGVVVAHGALSHHMAWFLDTFPLDHQDVVLHKTPCTFDASVWEIWAPLMSGGRLRLARPDGHRDPAYLADELRRGQVTVLQLVPSVLDALVDEPGLRANTTLRHLFCGGEALRCATVARAQALTGLPVINLYGPTEATIQCAWATVHAREEGSLDIAPLGQPIHNVTLSVRDHALRVVPVGTPGELCVSGPCLALGYWQDRAATAARFAADPDAPGQRVLRTGDRARILPDGTLEFLGRLDDQIKVRGMRVEPGEIEARLAALPGVAQAVVAARAGAGNRPRLIAWVQVQEAGPALDALRADLARQVPEHMMPAAWVPMHTWPRLPSGKIDRRALPAPAAHAPDAAALAPRPGVEAALAAIWRDVLAAPDIGAGDDFFALGGDSILCLQMVARARGQGLSLTTRDVFARPVLRQLAGLIDSRAASGPENQPEDAPADAPLTPAQAWFFELALPNPRHWNHAVLLAFREPVPAARVAHAVDALVARRDALRLRFEVDPEGRRRQRADTLDGASVLERVDLGPLPASARAQALGDHAAAVQTRLDPAAGPLFRAVHYDLGPDEPGRLLLVCHHLIVDGLSWRLLLQDLALTLCPDPAPLPAAGRLTVCARALAAHATDPALLPALAGELPFWQAQLDALPAIPMDRPDGRADNREGAAEAVTLTLPASLSGRLLGDRAAWLRATPKELLLAAFVESLARWSGDTNAQVAFMLEGHGRDRLAHIPEAADAVGWFTAMYPVRVALPELTAPACLKAVKTAVRAVPGDGSGYGLLRHVHGHQALAGRAEPVIGFNYLGRIDGSFDGAPFALAGEDVGPQVDPTAPRPRLLDLVIHVAGDQLSAAWQFCPHVHDRATIEHLSGLFAGAIERLLAHTAPRQALCPADFPLVDLSEERLFALLPDDTPARGDAPGPLPDLLPLTPVQEGMLYHALHDPRPGTYVQQVVAELEGEPRPERLQAAWEAVLAMHPLLRASFVQDGQERPLQRIHGRLAVPLAVVDLSALPAPALAPALDALLADDRRRGFAPDTPPLMRVTLVRTATRSWQLLWTHHHLLLDGWSLPLVFRDFVRAYQGALPAGEDRGHIEVLRWLCGRERDADAAFWREALADFPGATLPAGATTAKKGSDAAVEPAAQRHTLSEALTRALEHAARRHKVTLATLLQAAWALVLGRHGQSQDVVFGVTVAGRPDEVPGAATTVGSFLNTLPMRVRLAPEQPIAGWLADIRAVQAGLLAHQASALVDVARFAGVRGAPLFEAILVHENYPTRGHDRDATPAPGPDALAIARVTAHENNHYPLSLYVLPGQAMELALYHRPPRFDADAARALLQQVHHVLEALAADRAAHVGDLGLMAPAWAQSLDGWNRTERDTDMDRPVHARVRERAALTPEALAVVGDDAALSYEALCHGAGQLARRLAAAGVGPEIPVGVCMARSARMVTALLGVIEAGGYYVPLDLAFPDERLALMIQDAAPAWVLTDDAGLEARLAALGARTMRLHADAHEAGADAHEPNADARRATAPGSLAYAIFTSGSTGRPKGVAIPHRALSNILGSFARDPGLTAADRLLSVTTLSFDIAALEIFLPLSVGATVIVADQESTADPRALAALIERSQATVMQATPATWRMLLAAGWQPPRPGFRVWCGGEALTPELAAALLDRGVSLCNVYGPTETTIWSTLHLADPRGHDPAQDATRVGQPIANTTCYVVDDAHNPVPPGVPGELLIGGDGLARGYLGLAALTAERFVPDPFGGRPGARLYRTGDLARVHHDGRLEVLGRLDFQVKVRGFRVELGDIEAALTALPGVAQAVVVSAPDRRGEARLVAHLVAENPDQRPDAGALREALLARLPAYMVPSAWRYVDAYPLTANRKIDRKALAAQAPDAARPAATPPGTPLEAALVEIWREVLEVPELGVHDSFFELGGHSLTAARIHAQLGKVFRVHLPLAAFLGQPTVAGLAALVAAQDREPGQSLRIAEAYLRVRSMSEEDKARLRARKPRP